MKGFYKMRELIKKFNYYYKKMYNGLDYYAHNYSVLKGIKLNISELARVFDEAIENEPEIKKIVNDFTRVYYNDFISSDREAAALTMALIKCKYLKVEA